MDFTIYVVKTKGSDQLSVYPAAGLRLCFSIQMSRQIRAFAVHVSIEQVFP